MRRIIYGLALALTALPARAQAPQQAPLAEGDLCAGLRSGVIAPTDARIGNCTKLIESGRLSNANLAITYSNRGLAYEAKGLVDKAIADHTKAIALNPDYAAAYNNRAWDYHLQGQDAKGLPDAEKAVALAPNNAAIIETRAEIHEKLGPRDQAIADYRAALKLDLAMKAARDGLKRLGASP